MQGCAQRNLTFEIHNLCLINETIVTQPGEDAHVVFFRLQSSKYLIWLKIKKNNNVTFFEDLALVVFDPKSGKPVPETRITSASNTINVTTNDIGNFAMTQCSQITESLSNILELLKSIFCTLLKLIQIFTSFHKNGFL